MIEQHVCTRRGDPATGSDGRGWWRAALAVATVAWGANQFVPLLLMYGTELGLSATVVQATFGMYVLGLIPGMLLGGPVSDRFGRRPVIVPTLAASLAATVLLMLGGHAAGWLFAGRLLAGIASGAAFSSGAAWIKELSVAGNGNPGPRRLTVAMSAGFAAAPVFAGLLAQWAPVPTVTPYVPHLVLGLVALPLAIRAPETAIQARPGTLLSRLRIPGVTSRRLRTVVLPLAPWVFGTAAIALAYLPSLVADRLGGNALIFTSVTVLLTAGSGILVQPLARRLGHPQLITVSLGLTVAGMGLGVLVAATRQPATVLIAAIVLGAAYGATQVCGLTEVQRLAEPAHLAGLTAVYQAVSYLGFVAPFPLAALAGSYSPTLLLAVVTALAVLTLGWIAWATGKGSSVKVRR